jgi:hypothetical protein
VQLSSDLGARDPAQLGQRLALLYDGAIVTAWMDSDPSAPIVARQVAESLLDPQTAPKAPAKRAAKQPRKRAKAT